MATRSPAPDRGAAVPEHLPLIRFGTAAAPSGASVPTEYAPGVAVPTTESTLARTLRRLVTIPGYLLTWAVLLATAPIALPLLLLADRFGGKPRGRARLLLFAIVVLSYELAGLAISGLLWLAVLLSARQRGARSLAAHGRLQLWWATGLFGAASRILRLSLQVEGADEIGRGPVLVLIRHASLADSLLPSVVLGVRGFRLRYVLKRELLWDPCLDVVGQRLPNAFIRRGGGESAAELDAIAALGRDLESDEGVLIYPEGTRFTDAKRTRALERIAASGRPELLARARRARDGPAATDGGRALASRCSPARRRARRRAHRIGRSRDRVGHSSPRRIRAPDPGMGLARAARGDSRGP